MKVENMDDMEEIWAKQMQALRPFKDLYPQDIETRNSQHGERLNISVETTVEDDGTVVVMPVILFVPDVNKFEHEHIEIKSVESLHSWLSQFIEIQDENS